METYKNMEIKYNRIGFLTVIDYKNHYRSTNSKKGRYGTLVKCKCDCGNVISIPYFNLGKISSCGKCEYSNKKGIKRLSVRKLKRIVKEDISVNDNELKGRPLTRKDCANVHRPCPWVGCKYNNFLDITEKGSIILRNDIECPTEMNPMESCILDIIDNNIKNGIEVCHKYIGIMLHVSRERARQIEIEASDKLSLVWELREHLDG
jgi:hypothetical protein